MTRQEERLVRALTDLRRAVSALDIAIDYGHSENLHPAVLDAIEEICWPWIESFFVEPEPER